MTGLTREAPAPGVVVWQPARGFRYAADAFWLAGFALEGGRPDSAVDLGTGCGVVALLLAARGVRAVGVEVRPEWRACWERAEPAVRFEVADVRDWSGSAALSVCNPPYAPARTGPISPDPVKAAARTESTATLADFVEAALRIAPRACFVIPAARVAELPPASRTVYVGRKRALVELVRGGAPGDVAHVDEGDARVAGWYRLAGA